LKQLNKASDGVSKKSRGCKTKFIIGHMQLIKKNNNMNKEAIPLKKV